MTELLHNCPIPAKIRCPAAWLHTLIVLVLLAGHGAAADDGTSPKPTGAAWSQPVGQGQPARLPPIDSVSYETARLSHPACSCDPFIGYDRGFVVANHGTHSVSPGDFPFLMRVNSWFQLRHTLFESDGPNQDQNTFSFERLRLSFGGHVFSSDLRYFFQLDGNSDRSSQVVFLDYLADYDLGHDLFCWERHRFGVKAGKWKVPFSRSRAESGRLLQFTDRATANVFFDLNRSIGAGLYGRLDPFAVPVHVESAVFNGFQTGGVSTNRGEGLDRNFGWSMRAYADLFGDYGAPGESDYSWHERPALRVGYGLAYSRVDVDGTTEFGRLRVVDSGAALSSILPPGVTAYDVWLYTLDAHLKCRGFSFIADYYWRYISQFSGAPVASLSDQGLVLQAGYFVAPQKLELLFRWSRIVGDSGTLGLTDQSSDEVAGGLAWYLHSEHAKLVFDATHINGVPVNSSRLDMLPGDAGWLFRTQFQLAF